MISTLVVTIIGAGFVIRGFYLLKQFGKPEYKGREKYLRNVIQIKARFLMRKISWSAEF